MNVMKNNKGFSLVELMVVVAIIGILASVAIPQFSKFQARSRQSEAKAQLSGVYTAQKSFSAEWSYYYDGLRTVGYSPDATAGLRYNVAIGAGAASSAVPAGYNFIAAAGDSSDLNGGTMCQAAGAPAACVFAPAYTVAAPAGAASMSTTVFTAVASGNPNTRVLGNVDTWTINQDKLLRNTVAGID